MNNTEIAIVGGGMVGSTLACALAQAHFKVHLIEQQPEPESIGDDFELRVSALSRASQNLLTDLGAWQKIQAMRCFPYQKMQVEERNSFGQIQFSAAEIGEPDLGHIVENKVIVKALAELIAIHPHITTHYQCQVTQLKTAPLAYLKLDNGIELKPDLIVAADGGDSNIRNMVNIKTKGWLYDQHAVIATVETLGCNQATAWQRFMSAGPLALLPLDDKHCSIVWSTTPEHAELLLEMSDEAFCQVFSDATSKQWGGVIKTSKRASYPLCYQHAQHYIKDTLVLVGDAAHRIHPLAGQGVNLGFLDVACLTDVLIHNREKEKPLADYAGLRVYERTRKSENSLMMASMDIFKRLFSNNIFPLKIVRNIGLNIVNKARPIKHFFIKQALKNHYKLNNH